MRLSGVLRSRALYTTPYVPVQSKWLASQVCLSASREAARARKQALFRTLANLFHLLVVLHGQSCRVC